MKESFCEIQWVSPPRCLWSTPAHRCVIYWSKVTYITANKELKTFLKVVYSIICQRYSSRMRDRKPSNVHIHSRRPSTRVTVNKSWPNYWRGEWREETLGGVTHWISQKDSFVSLKNYFCYLSGLPHRDAWSKREAREEGNIICHRSREHKPEER